MLKTLLKVRLQGLLYGMSGAGKTDRFGRARGGKGGIIALAITLPLAFGIYFWLLLMFFKQFAAAADFMNVRWLHYALAAAIAVILAVFGSVFSTQSQLFDAQDNELLLSMPIKPRDILLSRLLLVYLLNFLFTSLVLLPCGIAALQLFDCTALGIAVYAVFCFLVPLFATALCCLLGWLLSLITAKVNNKAIMNTVMTVLFLVAFYVVYFRFINITMDESGDGMQALQNLIPNLERVFSQFLAPLYWIGKLFADGKILLGILAALVFVLPILLAVYLLSRSFFKITMSKAGAKKRVYRQKELRVSGIRSALIRKELKHFTSSAAYMTNCGLGLLMMLVAAVFLLIKRDTVAELSGLLPQLGFPQGSEALIVVLALCFLGFANTMTAPSVSLEGKSRWIVQSIPADLSHVLFAKADMQLLLTAPVLLIASAAAVIAFKLTGLGLVLALILPQIVNLLTALAGLWLNVLMPKYEWASETVPIKQSAPVALVMFGMMLYIMLFAGLYFLLLYKYFSAYVMLAIFGAVSAVLCIILWLWIRNNGGRKFIEAG